MVKKGQKMVNVVFECPLKKKTLQNLQRQEWREFIQDHEYERKGSSKYPFSLLAKLTETLNALLKQCNKSRIKVKVVSTTQLRDCNTNAKDNKPS